MTPTLATLGGVKFDILNKPLTKTKKIKPALKQFVTEYCTIMQKSCDQSSVIGIG